MFTPEFFNTLIVLNMVIGLSLAARRFYIDMTRKPKYAPPLNDATQPHRTQEPKP
jgi:hypothetical protein